MSSDLLAQLGGHVTRSCAVENALRSILAERERELLEVKGPCSNLRCSLHYAHSGPCGEKP